MGNCVSYTYTMIVLYFGAWIVSIYGLPIQQDLLNIKLKETVFAELDPLLRTNAININSHLGAADNLFQGDIVLSPEQKREVESSRIRRQAISLARKWTNNTVHFYFDKEIEESKREAVRKAHQQLQTYTCVNFVESSTAWDRIKVVNGSGCNSFVGMIGGEQLLSLGQYCDHVGTAAHEFIHALGMEHTHDRFDRDNFILINTAAINLLYLGSFNVIDPFRMTALVPYELGSIMHYAADAFTSGSGKNSIVAKNTNYTYTMGSGLVSFYDLVSINTLYKCTDQFCPADQLPKCKNGGMPNPRKCSECYCPSGYGGTLCEQRPPGCGQAFTATAEWQSFESTLGDSTVKSSQNDYSYCNFWIEAPLGKKIETKIIKMTTSFCSYGCYFNGIELKLEVNSQPTGARFCCKEFLNRTLTSYQNPMPLTHYNSFDQSNFGLQYRYIDTPCGSDHPMCNSTLHFCSDEAYSDNYRRHFCPKTCNFC